VSAESEIFGAVVDSEEEVEALRRIRNLGRMFMTGTQVEISPREQLKWWREQRKVIGKDFLPIIYRRRDDAEIVGYGILNRKSEGLYISLAVAPAHRGFGYGTSIYYDMHERAGEAVYAVVLQTNLASLSAARKAGYTVIGKFFDGIILVKE